jgi:hypothetical protein
VPDRERDEKTGKFVRARGVIVAPLPKLSKTSERMNELLRTKRSYTQWTEEDVDPPKDEDDEE